MRFLARLASALSLGYKGINLTGTVSRGCGLRAHRHGGLVSGTDIFLSYARQDRPAARIFAESFIEEGFSVWWDAALHSGETFDEVIEQRLRDAGAVVVLWSRSSVASRWVRAEATLADRRRKLAPAIIEPCDRPIIFELTHAAELTDWNGDRTDVRWRTFVEDLRRLLEANRQDEQPQQARPTTVEPSSHAPAFTRQALHPGNGDVIHAAQPLRPQPIRPAPAPEPLRAVPLEDDSDRELHCLEIEHGELPPELIVIDSSRVSIGRSAPADIILSHKSISREHCMIGLANDELFVTDLNSTNGTYIDDRRVGRATILPVGSVVRLGMIALRHSVRTRAEADRLRGVYNAAGQGGLEAGRLAATS